LREGLVFRAATIYPRPVFKDAKGNFDGRVFIGVMMGFGTVSGAALKLWWSIGDSVPPFWLWAVPVVFLGVGISAWIQRRRENASLRDRVRRGAGAVTERDKRAAGEGSNS
jgi:hypothetical protein